MKKSLHQGALTSLDTSVVWDVIVIGGGPAGMMAGGTAGEHGANVLLLEKNDILGKKLLITGGGRCNVTNAEFDNRKLLEKFKENSKYLFSAFSEWSVKETLNFFHSRKLDTKVEAEQRVFPITEKAESVQQTLIEYLKQSNVTVLSNAEVKGFIHSKKQTDAHSPEINTQASIITAVRLADGIELHAKKFILATGGKSRPETGSTGDGFTWLRKLGHTVVEPTPSLVPLALKDDWIKNLQGVTVSDIKLTVYQHGSKQHIKQSSKNNKILFTHFGITGPTVLNLSKDVGELLKYGEVIINLDLLPSLDYGKLNTRLQDLFKENNSKKLKNSLDTLILSSLVPHVLVLSGIDPNAFCHSITREERIKLVHTLKAIPLHVDHLLGTDKAIVTSSGVALDEVDFRTMTSRLYPNLYLVGDILNIDRPSGGYSLQLCWTTGHVAGKHSAS